VLPDIRIGIVGCGRVAGELHLPALSRVRGTVVVALSDTDPERLAALAGGVLQ
jgi:predicted dehydrogenase